jgi:hypothetical protein
MLINRLPQHWLLHIITALNVLIQLNYWIYT